MIPLKIILKNFIVKNLNSNQNLTEIQTIESNSLNQSLTSLHSCLI